MAEAVREEKRMAIKIGHASADERYRASGGAAGDQTGGEVCVRTWYSSPWDCVLRPLDPDIAEKSAKACEAACANSNIGYDQLQRNTLYEKAKLKSFDLGSIDESCECDCSSLMHICGIAGGADVPFKWNCFWTGNMVEGFLASGQYEALREAKYLSSDAYLKRGDILVNSKSHTAMALENGAMAIKEDEVEASSRPTGAVTIKTELPLLKKGSKGQAVWAMQTLLSDRGYDTQGVDSDFGSNTEEALKNFQSDHKLTADGECGAKSWAALIAEV